MTPLALFVWIFTIPLLGTPIVYFAGRWRRQIAGWLALVFMLAAWIPLALTVRQMESDPVLMTMVGGVSLRFDGLSLLLAVVVLGLGTLALLFSTTGIAGRANEEKYHAMLLLMTGVIVGLGCAGDLFNLWLWFETMAVSSYLLVAFFRDEKASLEAGVKYLVQSTVGSVLVLFGIALLFGKTGTLDLAELHVALSQTEALTLPVLAAGALFIAGFGIKVAIVPLHTWLPDAHAQAPSAISAMLSGVVIEAGLIALLRALSVIAGAALQWATLLLIFGALNMLVGNLLALRQKQVKRLLAFSSISHIGYMLLGLGITLTVGTAAGASGSFFHLLSHALMKGLAFLSAGALLYALHRSSHQPLLVEDLAGAAQRYPLAALALSVALLGLAGLPPLVGFMSKWQILAAGVNTHNLVIVGLVVFAALNSVLSLGYYAPVVNMLYRRDASYAVGNGQRLSWTMTLPLLLLGLAVVVLGVWPPLAGNLTEAAGAAWLAMLGG